MSANRGEPIDVHVRADAPHDVVWEIFRMGWYGGAGARRVAHGGPVRVGPQPPCPRDAGTGRIECAWPTAFTIATDPSWVSGIYLVRLTRDDGAQRYVVFVLRDDQRKGTGVVQASVTTWQAYNEWGGESLYRTSSGQPGGRAKEHLRGGRAGRRGAARNRGCVRTADRGGGAPRR